MATQSKTTDVGPVGLIPMGDYSPTATYTLLMTVLYNHDSWVCIAMDAEGNEVDVRGIAPDDPTHGAANWQALTDGGRAAVATANQMRAEFDTWFGANAAAGIRKTVSDWLASAQTAWNNWFGADANSGVRKTWSDWLAGVQSAWSTWFGADANSGVRKTWTDWFADIQTAWNTWFGADATSGIKKVWADFIAGLQQQWNEWFGANASSGVRKTWSDWLAGIQQTWTAWFGANASSGVQKDWADLSNAADLATAIMNEWNNHTPYVADGTNGDLNYWYIWNISTHQYQKSAYAKGDNLSWDDMTQADKDVLVAEMLASLEEVGFDAAPTENSDHAVRSGGIFTAFQNVGTAIEEINETLETKQDVLDFATEAECRAIVTMYGQASSSSDDSSSSSDEPSDSSDSSDDSSDSSDSSDDSTSSEDSSSSSDEPSSSSDSE